MLAALKGYYDGTQIVINEDERKNLNTGEFVTSTVRTMEEVYNYIKELRMDDRFKKSFSDTSPLIYYLQKSELYYADMRLFWENYAECDSVTSSVTVTEYLTNDKQLNQFGEIKCITVDELKSGNLTF